jgi:hypothetical protein
MLSLETLIMSEAMTCETLLMLLRAALLPNESLKFTILPHAQGLALLVQPLPRKPDHVPKEAEQARAALGMPLRLAGSPAQLAADLTSKLQGYAEARRDVHDSYRTLIEALNEAGKEAKAKTIQAGKNASARKVTLPPLAPASAPTTASAKSDNAPKDTGGAPPAPPASQSANTGVMQPASLL